MSVKLTKPEIPKHTSKEIKDAIAAIRRALEEIEEQLNKG